MKINLLARFLIIIGVALIASWIAYALPPLLGTDLAGGTSLLYELDMSKAPETGSSDLAARVIEVLKQRVDPQGVKGITWRVVEGKRIQIQMPHPSKEVLRAREVRDLAEKALKEVMWKQSEIEAVVKKSAQAAAPAEGKTLLDNFITERIAPTNDPATKADIEKAKQEAITRFEALTDASKKLDAVSAKIEKIKPVDRSAEDLKAFEDAKTEYVAALQKVLSQSVDFNLLTNLMKAADSPENEAAQKDLEQLPNQYPMQKECIVALIQAHKAELKLSGAGVESPEELQRLVTRAGVLDFRIAVTRAEIGSDASDASQSLKQRGPEQQVRANGTFARWFEIAPNAQDNFKTTERDPYDPNKFVRVWSGYYVIDFWAGQPYILCYDDHDHTLTHSDLKRKPWNVNADPPHNDPNTGDIMLPFMLDATGGNYMGDLTGQNKNRPMTILLDDRAMSAPNIMSQITTNGQITFGKASPSHPIDAIIKEAQQLKQIMDAGSLPATLQSEPISVENISPDMGQDNIDAGVLSAILAVCAVMIFMLVYYTITGAFANMALMLNLVLVLATMAMLRQPFTLPGIAGLVLTLGMAVDANVLINERIREEIHRGASLWMAIKQGYDKVFWTIFDANLTTSLTSIVLILVGSAEVRGFGVTLLIGLMIHMFTALYVTRTFMMAAVKWGVVRAVDDHSLTEYLKEIVTLTWLRNGHWPFMRVITVSNIDWIGMRRKFWVVSGIITFAGLAAFVLRGEDKYDIEFRGGTQITFQLKDPLSDLSQNLVSLSTDLELTRTHTELKNLQDTLKNTKSVEERDRMLKDIAAKLAADPKVVQVHPEVSSFAKTIKDAESQKTLNIDDVRKIIEGLKTEPGLAELGNARVYSVGAASERRYQMQTTIANAPQTFEQTLPEPLKKTLGPWLKDEPKIRHDLSATRVTFTLAAADAGKYPTEDELRRKIHDMAGLPGMKDLAGAELTSIGKLEEHRIEMTIPNFGIRKTLLEPLAVAFQKYLEIKPKLTLTDGNSDNPTDLINKHVIVPVTASTLQEVFAKSENSDLPYRDVQRWQGGAAIMLDNIQPPITADKLAQRISTIRRSSEFSGVPSRDFAVLPVTVLDAERKPVPAAGDSDARPLVRGVLITVDPSHLYDESDDAKVAQWTNKIATTEWKILGKAAAMEDLFEGVTSFDAVVAGQAKFRALLAIIISLVLIVIYVWVRFGGIRYGLGAILSLAHDAIVALAGTVLSGIVYNSLFHRHAYLNLTDFKINLTMIAAYLTVIGYSVNDTIVIFDRVRENRGKSRLPLTPKLINDAINQCFGRTIWTTFTVFIVVLIMYIWGGEGVRGFSFAMLIGVFTGAYSTLAIASPMLLAVGTADAGPRGPSPFTRKDSVKRVPELPEPEEMDEPEGDDPETAV